MITKKQHKLLSVTWARFEQAIDNTDWTKYSHQLLDLTLEESRDHDRFRGASIRRGMSIPDEARYFALKRVTEYYTGKNQHGETVKAPDVADYWHFQRSCYGAYAIAHDPKLREEIDKLFLDHGAALEKIASWDYCKLIEA